jgi:hypothetical protein
MEACLDVAALAEEAIALVRAQRRYAPIEFEVVRAGEPPLARGDPGAVAQILLNLLLNAADAVTSCEPGAGIVQVRVRGAPFEVRSGESREVAAARGAADAVECIVADQGSGIAPEDATGSSIVLHHQAGGRGRGGLATRCVWTVSCGRARVGEAPEGFRTLSPARFQAAGNPQRLRRRQGDAGQAASEAQGN